MCPNTPGKKKLTPRGRPSGRPGGSQNLTASPPQVIWPDTTGMGSHHQDQKLNQLKVENMKVVLEEFNYYEEWRVCLGLDKLEKSKAAIAKKYGLSPSTFGNRTLGRMQGYEH